MTAALRARGRWAWRRADNGAGLSTTGWAVARIPAYFLVVLAVAVIACAAAGLTVARRDDAQRLAEGHRAFDSALRDLHPVPGGSGPLERDQLAQIGRRTGLKDLRLDTDLMADRGREAQSLHDSHGRITGWISWSPDRALTKTMDWLWDLAGLCGVLLALGVALVLGATKRLTSALQRSAATVRRLSTQDPLTGLANRRLLLQRLEDTMATRRSWDVVVFALLDIDGFHEVNDVLGWAGGDAMLVNIVGRLKAGLPEGAVLARYQDDAFAIVVAGGHAQSASELADRVGSALAAPIFMDQMWRISASIGIAQAPEDGSTGDELSRRAVLALRAAKRAGRGTMRRFVPQIQQEHSERCFFLRELESAIRDDAFDVHYQPIVAAEGGGIVGVEALLRWIHPTRGPLSPAMFIPLAEENGLMVELGEIALKRALKDGVRWPDLFVSVNLSPVQMRSRALVPRIASILGETGMPATRVVLEVTEGVLINNPEETQLKLQALRSLGVSTALDDFGTGYSSLNYLQRFPFDRLKIDRSFVASLGTTGNAGAIVQSIVTLGHALGMKVLAEGVETSEQRVLLRLAGCDELQGFLFAKAAPAESIDRLLAQPPGARAARQSDRVSA